MQRVIGIGGVFFKSRNPAEVIAWYEKHLGMKPTWEGGVVFEWKQGDRPDRPGQTAWSPFKADTDYFEPSREPYMINYLVDDLEALLAALTEEASESSGARIPNMAGLPGSWIRNNAGSSCGSRRRNRAE